MKKYIYIFRTLFLTLILSSITVPVLIMASSSNSGRIGNPISSNTFADFASKILDIVIQIGFIVVVFFIVYSGFLFVSARGSEEKITTAKTAFLWTIIGAAILLGAKVLETAVQNTINQLK